MKYMGSKRRIAKYILPIMESYRSGFNQYWVEPFVGGANMIDKVKGNRIGADINPYLIRALELIRDNPTSIPSIITEIDYQNYKNNLKLDGLTGFVGFAMSFGGKWFGGYRRDVKGSKGCLNNMQTQTRRSRSNAIKQSLNLQNVKFFTSDYRDLTLPNSSIIYCDPPYKGTTKYKNKGFDHLIFWEWCRKLGLNGHTVFISEYDAPNDFKILWEKPITTAISNSKITKKAVEKLFMFDPNYL